MIQLVCCFNQSAWEQRRILHWWFNYQFLENCFLDGVGQTSEARWYGRLEGWGPSGVLEPSGWYLRPLIPVCVPGIQLHGLTPRLFSDQQSSTLAELPRNSVNSILPFSSSFIISFTGTACWQTHLSSDVRQNKIFSSLVSVGMSECWRVWGWHGGLLLRNSDGVDIEHHPGRLWPGDHVTRTTWATIRWSSAIISSSWRWWKEASLRFLMCLNLLHVSICGFFQSFWLLLWRENCLHFCFMFLADFQLRVWQLRSNSSVTSAYFKLQLRHSFPQMNIFCLRNIKTLTPNAGNRWLNIRIKECKQFESRLLLIFGCLWLFLILKKDQLLLW